MEDNLPILGRDHDQHFFNQVLSHYGAPAYVRRARRVEEELDWLLQECRQLRDRWLIQVRIRLETLRLLAGGWQALRPLLTDERAIAALEAMHAELQPRLRIRVERTDSPRKLAKALGLLIASLERFNRRWSEQLRRIDLSRVNEARDLYNRWYILEKECALRSPRLARLGFERQEPLTHADLLQLLPLLPVPQ